MVGLASMVVGADDRAGEALGAHFDLERTKRQTHGRGMNHGIPTLTLRQLGLFPKASFLRPQD